mmetsp:Transcript_24128/g.37601  ORF Transcript_24128/g.37601 Transcript_24128/m.37601 type:complete len:138 (-) Transcript_24128:1180-1593(-)
MQSQALLKFPLVVIAFFFVVVTSLSRQPLIHTSENNTKFEEQNAVDRWCAVTVCMPVVVRCVCRVKSKIKARRGTLPLIHQIGTALKCLGVSHFVTLLMIVVVVYGDAFVLGVLLRKLHHNLQEHLVVMNVSAETLV